MTSWKPEFTQGVSHFRAGKLEEAIDCFSQALKLGGDGSIIYDSRAAAYQKLGKLKNALRDAKAVIDLQPDRWQGYARSSRLFLQARKYDAASRMVELALERVPTDQGRRREEMVALQTDIHAKQAGAHKLISQRTYHFGKLPVEIATNMFSMVLEEDHAYVVTLAQVCRNWRTSVLGTPSFWRTLVLGRKRPDRKLKLWRERARDRFHELVLLEDASDYRDVFEELMAIPMDSLRVFRCELGTMQWIIEKLPSLTTDVIASLHTLVVKHPSFGGLFPGQLDTGQLDWRVLHLTRVQNIDYGALAAKLSRLETLYLADCLHTHQWGDFLRIFHRNSTLARLNLVGFFSSYEEGPAAEELPQVISVPCLIDVHMDTVDRTANVLLPRLTTSSLKSLSIRAHRERLGPCLTWLIAGPAATLTTLNIRQTPVDTRLFLNVLLAANVLESLVLTHIGDTALPVLKTLATIIASSSPHDQSSTSDALAEQECVERVCCPALRHLDVSHCPDVISSPIIKLVKLRLPKDPTPPQITDGSTVEMNSDRPCVRALESLILDGCQNVDPDVLPWLRKAVPHVSCVYQSKKDAKWRR
ncbi:hypothetical protein C8Q78DRAFT_1067697 [Trametes maxima]|nr:hypothetical protein C8Q78DRAFT_1067697 [Trametes maxima]